MQMLETYHQATPLYGKVILAFGFSLGAIGLLTFANSLFHKQALHHLAESQVCEVGQFPLITSRWPLEYRCMEAITSPPQTMQRRHQVAK
jgi:hypothetical protein